MSEKFTKPIRWVVVRTCNFTGNMCVIEEHRRRKRAMARVEYHYEFAEPDTWQFEYMRNDEAHRRGIYVRAGA